MRPRRRFSHVVDDDVVARLANVERHVAAHGADADKADFHACLLEIRQLLFANCSPPVHSTYESRSAVYSSAASRLTILGQRS